MHGEKPWEGGDTKYDILTSGYPPGDGGGWVEALLDVLTIRANS